MGVAPAGEAAGAALLLVGLALSALLLALPALVAAALEAAAGALLAEAQESVAHDDHLFYVHEAHGLGSARAVTRVYII